MEQEADHILRKPCFILALRLFSGKPQAQSGHQLGRISIKLVARFFPQGNSRRRRLRRNSPDVYVRGGAEG